MLASSDPVLYVVLLLVLAVLLVLLRGNRRRGRIDARLLAHTTGHPSAGLPRGLSMDRRLRVAADIATQLTAADLTVLSNPGRPLVAASGMDGQYQVDVLADDIVVSYLTNRGVDELVRTASPRTAVAAVTGHVQLTTG